MAGNHLGALSRDSEELTCTGTYITVRRAMETITTDAVLLIQFVRNGVHISLSRHGLMEGCVEHAHLRQSGHQLLNSVNPLKVCGVVQRSKVRTLLKGLENLVGKDY